MNIAQRVIITRNINQYSCVNEETATGPKNAGIQVMSVRLKVFDPKTFHIAIQCFPLRIADIEVSTSGSDVPKATTDSVNNDEAIHNCCDISSILSIKYFADIANIHILKIMIIVYLGILLLFSFVRGIVSSIWSVSSQVEILYKMKITINARRKIDSCQVTLPSQAKNRNSAIETKKNGRSTSIRWLFTLRSLATNAQIQNTNNTFAIFDQTAPSITYSGNHHHTTA